MRTKAPTTWSGKTAHQVAHESAHEPAQAKSGRAQEAVPFADNRLAAAAQRRLDHMADQAPRTRQLRSLSALAHTGGASTFQLKTTIANAGTTTINNPSNTSETLDVGLGMTAHLDPSDMQSGSAVDTSLSGPLQDLTYGSKRRYVQGHLLNSRAGGSGKVADNLTPLSYSANSNHFHQVEKGVISELKSGNTVDYVVTPNYGGTPRAAATGLENDMERNFASELVCDVTIGSGAKKTTKVPNVPPYPA